MKSIVTYGVVCMVFFVSFSVAHASTILSTIKIDDSTANGPTLSNNDQFGTSITNIGDVDSNGAVDFAVGAILDDAGGNNRGAVHILFMNVDGTVSSTVEINDSTLNGPVLADSDRFGSSIVNIGDLNSDGVVDLVVGAPKDSINGLEYGAIHLIFLNANGTPSSTIRIDDTTLNGPVLEADNEFGQSLARLGDINSDGTIELAVGIDDDGLATNGAVYILSLTATGSVSTTTKIDESMVDDLESSSAFGLSVANIGDLNEDGVVDIAVGARIADGVGTNQGAVFLLFLTATGSVQSSVKIDGSTARGPSLMDNDFFGHSVVSLGDRTGDGVVDIAVGASGDDTDGVNRGAVYVLALDTDGSVNYTYKIDNTTVNGPTLADNDQFGFALTNPGDFNNDSIVDLVVVVPTDSIAGSNRGAMHMLFLLQEAALVSLNPLDNATGVDSATNLTLTFSGGVSTSTGSISIYRASDNTLIETIDIAGTQVTQSASNTIVINPSVDLERGVEHYINLASTTIVTGLGFYAGITDTTTWSFTIDPPAGSSSGGGGGGGGGGSRSLDGFSCHDPKALNYNTEKNHRRATCIYDASKLPTSTPKVTPNTPSALVKIREIVRANKALILEAQKMGIVIPPALLALLNDTPVNPVSNTSVSIATIIVPQRDLWIGIDHPDVILLQKFLNANGFVIAQSGVGSSGNETTYFGNRTQDALRAYQVRYGITPAIGTFGPKTRAHMLSL